MLQSWKTFVTRFVPMTIIGAVALVPSMVSANEDRTDPRILRVGTMDAPPFVIKTEDGRWEGLSIELWRAVARDLKYEYELVEFDSLDMVLRGFEKKELDVFPAMAITDTYEIILDLSHPFLTSGSAIAVPTETLKYSLFGLTELAAANRFLVLKDFLMFLVLLILLAFVAGGVVWVFESRYNSEMFGGAVIKGIWSGIWWAVVTSTTVGYGDKAPKTIGGRVVAICWMFASIILIAGFTAVVTTSLTIGGLKGKVNSARDLYSVRVGTVAGSKSLNFLNQHGISTLSFETEQGGLLALVDKNIDAFFFNELILKDLVKKEFPGRIHVLSETFDNYYIGMALADGSTLREPINRALLKITDTKEWDLLMKHYIGSDF